MTEVNKHPLANCEECPLKEAPFVSTENLGKKTALVSRSPGAYDCRAGKPFSNPRGSKAVLDHLLALNHVKRSDVTLTNVVLCQTDEPSTDAIKCCSARLESEIADCDVVIAAGTEAINTLTSYRTVSGSRGFSIPRTSPVSKKKQRVVATNNPAAVTRKSDLYPDMVKDFKRTFNPPPPVKFPEVEIIEDADEGCNIIGRWKNNLSGIIASDLEWRGREIVCAGFSRSNEKAVVFGLRCFGQPKFRASIKSLYETNSIRFAWHNGKSDTSVLRRNSINGRIDEDTHLISYDLDERPGYHTLEYLLSENFGWPDYEPESVKHFKKTGEFSGSTDEERRQSELELYYYNGLDASGTFMFFDKFRKDPDLDEAHYQYLLKAARAFTTVQLNGFHYDSEEACNINEREVYYRLWELEDKLREISGHTLLNPRSHDQVKAIVYDEWGLKHGLKDTGKIKFSRSTRREVREEIAAGRFKCHPKFKQKLIEFNEEYTHYQKITKLQSSFIEGLVKRVAEDGKLYTNFNIGGTVTGRPSSTDPNFNNVAREGYEEIPGIRTLFLPSPGNVIVAGDLSQAELRACAKLSGDRNLLGIYRDSERSLHKERAAAFYGAGYTYEQYVKSKNINFGVTYGQSAFAFAQMYHMPKDEAQAYIDSWWKEFPTLKEWTVEVGNRATKEHIRTPFGHRRRFHLVTDENIGDVKREAVNCVPQNIAAWLTICALVDLVNDGVRIVATVYDSIVADVPVDEAQDVAKRMQETMQIQAINELGWSFDDIPFLADVSIGPNWGTLEEVEFRELIAA